MKIKTEYALRQIGDDFIIVPIGESMHNFNGLISVNETGKLIWENLLYETTTDKIVDIMLEEYEIDRKTALEDIEEFLSVLKRAKIIEES